MTEPQEPRCTGSGTVGYADFTQSSWATYETPEGGYTHLTDRDGSEHVLYWTRDDGGRAAAGFRGVAGDCGVRAAAIASGVDLDRHYRVDDQVGMYVGFEQLLRVERLIVETETLPEYSWLSPKKYKATLYRPFGGGASNVAAGSRGRGVAPEHGALELPYDEAVWERLCKIRSVLEEMHRQLREITTGRPEEIVARLASAQPLLVGGP